MNKEMITDEMWLWVFVPPGALDLSVASVLLVSPLEAGGHIPGLN